jgi:hypothetical protein
MRNKQDKERQEHNEAPVKLSVFLESYNQSIPAGFSRATVTTLKKFEEAHPVLFRQKDAWSVDRHRKKLMDWLSSNPDV